MDNLFEIATALNNRHRPDTKCTVKKDIYDTIVKFISQMVTGFNSDDYEFTRLYCRGKLISGSNLVEVHSIKDSKFYKFRMSSMEEFTEDVKALMNSTSQYKRHIVFGIALLLELHSKDKYLEVK